MSDHYYVRIRGRVAGPYDLSQLKDLKDRGQLSPIHEVSEDRVAWRPVRECDVLFGLSSSASGLIPLAGDSDEDGMGVEILPEAEQWDSGGLIPMSELAAMDAQPSPAPAATAVAKAEEEVEPEEPSPDSRFLKFLLIGSGATILLIVGTILTVHFVSQSRTNREIAALTRKVDNAIRQAGQDVAEHEFDEARRQLADAEAFVRKSSLAIVDAQLAKLKGELANVDAAQKDYGAKRAQGWIDFEGQFISPEEKRRILAERKRQEEERRAEEARREQERIAAEQRRQEEERRRRAEELKASAYVMSQEFIRRSLKAPSTARFPDYSDRAVTVTYSEKDGQYTVMAWVEAQNAFGVHLRKNYICVLWPAGGDLWKSSMAELLGE